MKTLVLTLCLLLWAAPALMAQTLDPVIQDAIAHALPPAYVIYVPLIALVVGSFARYLKGRKNGLSRTDALMAVLCGTNTPTGMLLVAGACLLSLSSCATANAILASPFGRAAVATADQLAKAVITTTEKVGLEQIILQATAKVSALNAEGIQDNPVEETLRQSQMAGFSSVILFAQDKYLALTGKRFVLPKNPVLPVMP